MTIRTYSYVLTACIDGSSPIPIGHFPDWSSALEFVTKSVPPTQKHWVEHDGSTDIEYINITPIVMYPSSLQEASDSVRQTKELVDFGAWPCWSTEDGKKPVSFNSIRNTSEI